MVTFTNESYMNSLLYTKYMIKNYLVDQYNAIFPEKNNKIHKKKKII